MSDAEILQTADQIFQAVFGRKNPYSIAELRAKFASKLQLPEKVTDSRSGEETYSILPDAGKFITDTNATSYGETQGWLLPRRPIRNLHELLELYRSINYLTTERVYDSEHVRASDPIYGSQNVYASTNCGKSKNLLFCSGDYESSFCLACARSSDIEFCIRADDSNACTNSYQVICSGKISNSMFIQDANDLHECIFCCHISGQKYCIANMQFSKDEYFYLKERIIEWVFADD